AAFSAKEVAIEGLTTSYAIGAKFGTTIDTATLRNVSAPMPSADRFGAAAKPGELPALAAWLLAIKAASMSIPSLTFKSEMEGASSTLVYKDIELTGIDAGKIASMVMGSTSQESVASQGDAAIKLTMGKLRIDEVDLAAYAAWFDDSLAAAAP